MKNNPMPYDINKHDSFFGTIVSTNHNGVKILLETEDVIGNVFAFAFCGGQKGQRVMVSVRNYSEKHNNFQVKVDSHLIETTPLLAEIKPIKSAMPISA